MNRQRTPFHRLAEDIRAAAERLKAAGQAVEHAHQSLRFAAKATGPRKRQEKASPHVAKILKLRKP